MEEHIKFSPPDLSIDEIKEVADTIQSGWITTGPKTKLLERRLAAYLLNDRNVQVDCNTPESIDAYSNRTVCLSSATAAEEMNLRILGIGPGDEVIVPAYTYTSSASAILHCGATVRFIDIQKDGNPVNHAPEADYEALAEAINEKTKAVLLVDYGGIICDYEKAFSVVEKADYHPVDDDGTSLGNLNHRIQQHLNRIAILSDSAHSFGASRKINGEWKLSGTIADFTSFSFHAVKNLTTAEGGFSMWKSTEGIANEEIYHYYQLLSNHGQNKDASDRLQSNEWEYDIIGPWYKCNMTDITASIGLRQLDRYPDLLARRRQIVDYYDKVCDELGLFHLNHRSETHISNCHLYPVRIPGIDEQQRNKLIGKLRDKGVPTNVHFKPLPMMSAYKSIGADIKDFPNSYDYYKNLITLPLHTLLTDSQVEYICDSLKAVL